jgi:hypothetical protein
VRSLEYKLVDDLGRGTHYFFDLRQDPGERSDLSDFESELGKRAVAGYTTEVQRIDAFINLHPPVAESSNVPERVQGALEHLGYTEGKPTTPKSPR